MMIGALVEWMVIWVALFFCVALLVDFWFVLWYGAFLVVNLWWVWYSSGFGVICLLFVACGFVVALGLGFMVFR